MPVTKSAQKAVRNSQRKQAYNRSVMSRARTLLKAARSKPTASNIAQAYASLDKAAKKGVIHQGKADRLKSRLGHPTAK